MNAKGALLIGFISLSGAIAGETDWAKASTQLCEHIKKDDPTALVATIKEFKINLARDYRRLVCQEDGKNGSLLRLVADHRANKAGQILLSLLSAENSKPLAEYFNTIEADGKTLLDHLKDNVSQWLTELERENGDHEHQAFFRELFLEQVSYLFDFRKNGARFACELGVNGACDEHHQLFLKRMTGMIETLRRVDNR